MWGERRVIERAVERLRESPYLCNKCGFYGELENKTGIHPGCTYLAARSLRDIDLADGLEALLSTPDPGEDRVEVVAEWLRKQDWHNRDVLPERYTVQARELLALLDLAPTDQGRDGASLIAAERKRQLAGEGWTREHDNSHADGELVDAAVCYLQHGSKTKAPEGWPWEPEWWKPKDDIRNFVRAGALIAAEIDRYLPAPTDQEADERLADYLAQHKDDLTGLIGNDGAAWYLIEKDTELVATIIADAADEIQTAIWRLRGLSIASDQGAEGSGGRGEIWIDPLESTHTWYSAEDEVVDERNWIRYVPADTETTEELVRVRRADLEAGLNVIESVMAWAEVHEAPEPEFSDDEIAALSVLRVVALGYNATALADEGERDG